ncbi:MAG: hypothetical protein ICV64_13045, partial [Thermoleophilia bacterium]|nr:hypothetical protein [Thermoleophilia bacterium]
MSDDRVSEQLARAQAEAERGEVARALETLEATLWTAVGRSDWPTVAAVEHVLADVSPRVQRESERRRCEYLLHAARENLRTHAGEPEEEAGDQLAPPPPADLEERVACLERQLADLRGAALAGERRVQALELELQALATRARGAPPPVRPAAPPPA